MAIIGIEAAPADGIRFSHPQTRFVVGSQDFGEGALFVTESNLAWWNAPEGKGFAVDYPSIAMHAVSRDAGVFSAPCIYCQLEDDGAEEVRELRLVPSDQSVLMSIYTAMSDCQALHPSPDEDTQGDDEMFMNVDEVRAGAAEERLRHFESVFSAPDGHNGDGSNGDDDRYEDADDMEQ